MKDFLDLKFSHHSQGKGGQPVKQINPHAGTWINPIERNKIRDTIPNKGTSPPPGTKIPEGNQPKKA